MRQRMAQTAVFLAVAVAVTACSNNKNKSSSNSTKQVSGFTNANMDNPATKQYGSMGGNKTNPTLKDGVSLSVLKDFGNSQYQYSLMENGRAYGYPTGSFTDNGGVVYGGSPGGKFENGYLAIQNSQTQNTSQAGLGSVSYTGSFTESPYFAGEVGTREESDFYPGVPFSGEFTATTSADGENLNFKAPDSKFLNNVNMSWDPNSQGYSYNSSQANEQAKAFVFGGKDLQGFYTYNRDRDDAGTGTFSGNSQ